MSSQDALRDFLARPELPDGTLGFDELPGFLFAVANAPDLIMPSDWIPAIFDGVEPTFDDRAQAQTISTALMELYNDINQAASDIREGLPPGCVLRDDPLANLEEGAPVAAWARGFRAGYEWLNDAWDEAIPDSHPAHDEFIFAVLTLSFFGSRRLAEDFCAATNGSDLPRVAELMAKTLPIAAGQYVALGRSVLASSTEGLQTRRRSAPKVGRNDPCSCGSGRKYKRCCGTVH